jgi:hypothetical protein
MKKPTIQNTIHLELPIQRVRPRAPTSYFLQHFFAVSKSSPCRNSMSPLVWRARGPSRPACIRPPRQLPARRKSRERVNKGRLKRGLKEITIPTPCANACNESTLTTTRREGEEKSSLCTVARIPTTEWLLYHIGAGCVAGARNNSQTRGAGLVGALAKKRRGHHVTQTSGNKLDIFVTGYTPRAQECALRILSHPETLFCMRSTVVRG